MLYNVYNKYLYLFIFYVSMGLNHSVYFDKIKDSIFEKLSL